MNETVTWNFITLCIDGRISEPHLDLWKAGISYHQYHEILGYPVHKYMKMDLSKAVLTNAQYVSFIWIAERALIFEHFNRYEVKSTGFKIKVNEWLDNTVKNYFQYLDSQGQWLDPYEQIFLYKDINQVPIEVVDSILFTLKLLEHS